MRKLFGVNVDYDRNCTSFLVDMGDQIVIDDSVPVAEKVSAVDALIKVIYKPDERTGLPTGDLSYYVSDSVNPEIKSFILQNLLMDTSSVASPKIPDGISEQDAFDLMRGRDESVDDYRARLNSFAVSNVERAKFLYDNAKKSPVASE